MRVDYQKTFLKELDRLPKKIEEKFYVRLELFLKNPGNDLLKYHSVDRAYPECYSINITGDYRAIFRQEDNLVIFLHIGTHSQLYG